MRLAVSTSWRLHSESAEVSHKVRVRPEASFYKESFPTSELLYQEYKVAILHLVPTKTTDSFSVQVVLQHKLLCPAMLCT